MSKFWGFFLIGLGIALLGVAVAMNTKENPAPAWLWTVVAFYAGMTIRHILGGDER